MDHRRTILTRKNSVDATFALFALAKARAFGTLLAKFMGLAFFTTGVTVMGLAAVEELFWAWGWLGLLVFIVGIALID